MTTVAVIGSSGWLGSALVRHMQGYQVREVDIAIDAGEGKMRGDARLTADMLLAVEGVDAVVLLVAWHGGHHPRPTNEAFFETNVVSVFRVLEACAKHDVRHIVWAASIAATGAASFYGTTKILGEDLCRHYHLAHGFNIAMMRYGAFTPCDFVTYGQRLLNNGVDRRDCVEATSMALRAVLDECIDFGAYTILPDNHSNGGSEGGNGPADPRNQWSEFDGLMVRYGLTVPDKTAGPDLRSTREDLGWEAKYDFGAFLRELHRMDEAGVVSPESPRWWFETGKPPPEDIVWPDQ